MTADDYLKEQVPEAFQKDTSEKSTLEKTKSINISYLQDKGLKLDRDNIKYIGWIVLTLITVKNYMENR